ncbi:ER-golgi trafficking TRAPP I complex 85 kDa subunit-domain-containing protein [Lipomyces japonicus]|uniref:ER-golgi trafficking TRAPP I complex 85 kDa subunit-domain-containing protein n=1 Tax=Lipomyces japonicus TaxID=56871 RepID=UPI0034CD2945
MASQSGNFTSGRERSRGPPNSRAVRSSVASSNTSSSLSISLSSIIPGHVQQHNTPLSPNNGVSPSHLSAIPTLIAQSYSPRISVLASEDVDKIAKDKGFPSILELLKPFGDLVPGIVTIRDYGSGQSNQYDNFSIRFISPTAPNNLPDFLSPNVPLSRKYPPAFEPADIDVLLSLCLEKGPQYLLNDASVPPNAAHDSLYYKFLQRLLASPPISPHETFQHPVASVIAVSSRNANPLETLSNLYKTGNDVSFPPYMSKDFMRFYLYVHDEDQDELEKSIAIFERMKRHFGFQCAMIRVRSKVANLSAEEPIHAVTPSHWISALEEVEILKAHTKVKYIFSSDVTSIQNFIKEFVVQHLVPFMERCISNWNEQVAANRRGIAGRLFSASRRFLGSTNKSGGQAVSGNYDYVAGYYGYQTSEWQLRKLADFAFMLRDWKLAHNIYELLRKDFLNDKAWKFLAGSQEFTAASLILTGTPLSSRTRLEILEPLLDGALFSYINRSGQHSYALRAGLIVAELLRSRGGGAADDAAKWLMKTLKENQAVTKTTHALLLERMSACYLTRKGQGSQLWGNRRRKAAFWQLVAAKEWVILDRKTHARVLLDDAGENVYDALDWADQPGTLLYELRHSTESMVYDSSLQDEV